jgi:peptidoglycan/LPS O-acetylase OafA/YrhL/lysophospholipase L1-like esterase
VYRRSGLDGLRAVAVIAVVLYHADLSWVPGGFLGVDVFFVLSGYLITSLLLNEWRETGRLDFGRFYRARARRLLPGLLMMLAATTVVTTLAVPDAAATVRRDLLPALSYVSNWWAVAQHHSYFEATGRPSLLLHLWSLAVEEQFYLLWPVLLLLILRGRPDGRGQVWLFRLAVGGAVVSAAAMAVLAIAHGFPVPNDPSRGYYGTDTHASGLLLGAALATRWPLSRTGAADRRSWWVGAGGVVGLVGLLCAFGTVSEFSPLLYRGGFLLVSALSVGVVAAASRDGAVARMLAVAPLRRLGERSYGIYLWHWPVFALTRPQLDVQESGPANLALRLVLTLGLAELSWRYVETPIRAGALAGVRPALRRVVSRQIVDRLPALRRRLRVPAAAAVLTLLLAAGFAVDRPAGSASVSMATVLQPPGPDPETTPPPLPDLPPGAVTAWGDSVMLGARSSLRALLPAATVDAAVGRRAEALPADLAALRNSGRLGPVVVLHLGDNGLFSRRTLDRALASLQDRRRVVLVTIRVPRRWQEPVNGLLRSEAEAHANVVLADWSAASTGHPEYVVGDGVHLSLAGSRAFAATIARSIG